MFEFLKRQATPPPPSQPLDIDKLTQQLVSAVRAQIAAGNITAADLQKIVHLCYDGARLRSALTYL